MPTNLKDWRGTTVKVGSHVVYPSRQFGNMWISEGVVTGIQDGKVAVRKIRSSAEHKQGNGNGNSQQTAYPSLARLTVLDG